MSFLLWDVFRQSGYRTGLFGKWRLGCNYPFRPIDRGFDEGVGHGDGGTGTASDYWGDDNMNDTYWRNGKWESFSGFGADVFFDEAMRFFERKDRRPFFNDSDDADRHSEDRRKVSEQ